jgi:hypothetical protein
MWPCRESRGQGVSKSRGRNRALRIISEADVCTNDRVFRSAVIVFTVSGPWRFGCSQPNNNVLQCKCVCLKCNLMKTEKGLDSAVCPSSLFSHATIIYLHELCENVLRGVLLFFRCVLCNLHIRLASLFMYFWTISHSAFCIYGVCTIVGLNGDYFLKRY